VPDRCAALIAVLLGLVFLHLASSAPVGAQPRPNQPSAPSIEDRPVIEARAAEREHFQLKIGPSYDEGDFGTSQKTRTFFFPFTLRYLGERWDLGVTTSFVRLDAPGNVVIVDGQPQNTRGAAGAREVNSGFGDMVLKGRYYVVDDPGPDSWLPTLAPFLKLKLPTADENKGLGTGEVDWASASSGTRPSERSSSTATRATRSWVIRPVKTFTIAQGRASVPATV